MALPASSLGHLALHDGEPSSPGRDLASRSSNLALRGDPALRGTGYKGGLTAKDLKTAAQLHAALEFQHAERVLGLGIPALDEVLPQRGLLEGSVVELQVRGASGAATSFALCACRAAQHRTHAFSARASSSNSASHNHKSRPEPERNWCAFVDPSATLFAPGVARLGVDLSRLLVVRPEVDAVERTAIRIAEAKAVSLLVVDLRGALGGFAAFPGMSPGMSHHRWQRTVRRLALAVKQLATCVLLITPAEPRASLPLPVAMRLEFSRSSAESFEVRVGKERTGRVSAARTIQLSAFQWSAFEGGVATTARCEGWR